MSVFLHFLVVCSIVVETEEVDIYHPFNPGVKKVVLLRVAGRKWNQLFFWLFSFTEETEGADIYHPFNPGVKKTVTGRYRFETILTLTSATPTFCQKFLIYDNEFARSCESNHEVKIMMIAKTNQGKLVDASDYQPIVKSSLYCPGCGGKVIFNCQSVAQRMDAERYSRSLSSTTTAKTRFVVGEISNRGTMFTAFVYSLYWTNNAVFCTWLSSLVDSRWKTTPA